jgi:hypothetical protein
MRDCMVNEKKDCEVATSEPYKQSDTKDFSADAKIIIALLKRQPLTRLELCKDTGINEATFSRNKRLLTNRGIMKEDKKGFSLWNYFENPSLWESLVEKMKNAGGHLIKLQIEKLRLGDYDKITGIPESIYDKVISTEGIIILRGATKLEEILGLRIPPKYVAFLASPFPIQEGDRFKFERNVFYVLNVESFYEGETLNYTLTKLSHYPIYNG